MNFLAIAWILLLQVYTISIITSQHLWTYFTGHAIIDLGMFSALYLLLKFTTSNFFNATNWAKKLMLVLISMIIATGALYIIGLGIYYNMQCIQLSIKFYHYWLDTSNDLWAHKAGLNIFTFIWNVGSIGAVIGLILLPLKKNVHRMYINS